VGGIKLKDAATRMSLAELSKRGQELELMKDIKKQQARQ
jgi:hypothetical protein